MASRITRSLIYGALCSVALGSAAVHAQRAGGEDDDQQQSSGGTIGATTGKILQDAFDLLSMDNYEGAKARLADIRMDRLSPYELSRVEETLAQISNAEGDTAATREHLQKAIDSGGLNAQEAATARYNIASLYVIDEKYADRKSVV